MKPILLLLTICVLCSGCLSWAWRGYKKPGAFQSVSTHPNCMEIGMQNLNKKQKKAIEEAAGEVCRILASDEFKNRVLSRKWLASCDLVNGQPHEMTGQQVYDLINKKVPNYSVHPRHPWRAVAQTDPANARVAIKPVRIKQWSKPDEKDRALLVNTIAHETMHMLSGAFRDGGHGSASCPDSALVSYGIGDLVAELWLKNH